MAFDRLNEWLKKTVQGSDKAPVAPSAPPTTPHKIPAQKPPRPAPRSFATQRIHAPTPRAQAPVPHVTPQTAVAPTSHHASGVLRCIPLGGLNEVGKNCMVVEYGKDAFMIDLGFQFPEENMPGVDYVIPDVSYLLNRPPLKGIVLTHGHMDHIGGIAYLIEKLKFPPIYGTSLTLGILKRHLGEFGLGQRVKLHTIDPKNHLKLGVFDISFFRVNHSIPDAVGIVARTPVGSIVHTGDFKFDMTPADADRPADFAKIASLSTQNILMLFSDSTNAMETGHTVSEKKVGDVLDDIIKTAEGRVVIAAFASLVGRIQQIIKSARRYNRKVFVTGRSMLQNIDIAVELGFLKIPPATVFPVEKAKQYKDNQILILTTGSQGEDISSLTRMSKNDHAHISIKKGDTVVLSSSPIIGNEKAIVGVINNLCRLGAHVISNHLMDVHVSGHAKQEDLKMMLNFVKPKYFVPVHGELYMRMAHKELALATGMTESQIFLVDNGEVLEANNRGIVRKTPEKVPAADIVVDGRGVVDIGTKIMLERQVMAENGVLIALVKVDAKTHAIIGEPEIVYRGFMYLQESQKLAAEIKKVVVDSYATIRKKDSAAKQEDVRHYIRAQVEKFVRKALNRNPLVLPIFVQL